MTSNKEAFLQLMQENKGIIYKICKSYCAEESAREDLAQEIVYHLWKAFATFDVQYKFSTWMYRIALNVAISYYRKERKLSYQIPLTDHLNLFEDMTSADNESDDDIRLLEKFIRNLGEIDRSIMLLYLDDKSYKEIAVILGISETNVATKINRIKTRLKTSFVTSQNKRHGVN